MPASGELNSDIPNLEETFPKEKEESVTSITDTPKKTGYSQLIKGVKRRKRNDEKRVRELEAQVKDLKKELLIEPLTGLRNLSSSAGKKELDGRLSLEARDRGEEDPIVFVSIDFDGLHQANELYTRENADHLMKIFGEVLDESSRDSDYPFREGDSGDEFGIVFFGFEPAELEEKVQEMNDLFVAKLEALDNDPRFNDSAALPKDVVSFSAGVTEIEFISQKREDGEEYHVHEEIFGGGGVKARAEDMYHKAKNAGRNRFVSDWHFEPQVIREGFKPPDRTAFDNIPRKEEKPGGNRASGMLSIFSGLFR